MISVVHPEMPIRIVSWRISVILFHLQRIFAYVPPKNGNFLALGKLWEGGGDHLLPGKRHSNEIPEFEPT